LGSFKKLFNIALVRTIGDDKIIKKVLPAEKTYLYLENEDGDILEGTPKLIRPNYFIVILDNDVKKSFMDLLIEVFGLEESVDKHFIVSWKIEPFKFIEDNDLSYADFYRMYLMVSGKRDYQTVMGWAKGHVLGPLDPLDLYYIGKILENTEIIEDYNIIYK
jgi:hypothetical protein